MPSLEIEGQVQEPEKEAEPTIAKPIVGIIYPPPEVRNIVDKTASFVARNGPDFESRIKQHEQNNVKFNFLNQTDPYHAYYEHKVKEFAEGKAAEPTAKSNIFQSVAQQQAELLQLQDVIPKEPPPEFEFSYDPPSISAFDLDVVKLTAQFVARNGRQFLTNLMNKEQRNYQFDFLRPQHSLFNYFTKLVEQYTKILIPPKDLLSELRIECDNPKSSMDKVRQRVEWARYQEREKKKEAEARERERVAYAQIDWHDFVVVETVDFQPHESGNLPPPTTPDEVGVRVLAQERVEKGEADPDAMDVESDEEGEEEEGGEEEEEEEETSSEEEDDEEEEEEEIQMPEVTEATAPTPAIPPPPPAENIPQPMGGVEDMDESDEDDDEVAPPPMAAAPPPPPPEPLPPPLSDIDSMAIPLPPAPSEVVIRRGYDPKAKMVSTEDAPDEFMVSPITGEKIPARKVHEHMRIGLLDPKWIEERNRSMTEKREQEEVFAPGAAIDSSLKMLAERRTDIFGVGAEETQIGKKIGEEEVGKKDTKEVWDGHTASMEKVTQKAREHISLGEQLIDIQKRKGLIADAEKEKIGPKPVPPSAPAPPPPPSEPPKPAAPPMPPGPPMAPAPPPPMRFINPAPPIMMMPGPPRQPMNIIGLRPGPPMGQPMRPPMGGPMGGPMGPPMAGPMGPPMMMRPGFPVRPMPPRPAMILRPKAPEDEPPAKKAKTEESLIPEHEFLANNKSPVAFKVLIPHMPDKSEWDLHGQFLAFTMPLEDSISVLKAKIHTKLGLAAGKQKLQIEGLFMKDSNTLAFYNFTIGCIVQLALKERGGRKK